MEVADWLQTNMQTVLGTPVAWLGLIIGALMLPASKTRRGVGAMIVLIIVVQLVFICWVAYRQTDMAKGAKKPPRRAPTATAKSGTPAATPRLAATPQSSPTQDLGETDNSNAVQFSVSSKEDPSIRYDFCLDSDFKGEVNAGANSVDVTIGKAVFDLCTGSEVGKRQAQFQVGVGKNEDVRNNNKKAILWSKPVTGEVTAKLPVNFAPQQFSFKRTQLGKKNKLSGYGLIIRVYNPERRGEYFLYRENVLPAR